MLDRRLFLKSGAVAMFALGAGPSFLQRAAWASGEGGSRRRVLVALFQRGAMDGLAAVPPLGGASGSTLSSLRPRLALAATRGAGSAGALDLGVGFGLHPALAPLLPLWRERRLAIVHCVGSPDPTRSHFDAQDYMESGTPGRKGTASGWLNRVCGELGHDATPFRAVATTAAVPRSLAGPQPALAIEDLRRFGVQLPGAAGTAEVAGGGFESLYGAASQELLRTAGSESFEAIHLLSEKGAAEYRPAAGVSYPASPLGNALREVAQLVKADLGLEVAFVESAGWDTHVQQGAAQGGFARRAEDLARAVAAFWTDLGERQSDVVLMTMTEFGRTVSENGSGGTDHGHGSCLFVLGDRVDGGRVHGNFPGLAREQLHEGRDLPVTTDFRAAFAGVAAGHLGVREGTRLFPGWSGPPLALVRVG